VPSQIVLPAGSYGIVGLVCHSYRWTQSYTCRAVERGSKHAREAVIQR
jgi:hypothetical protein